ncbi:MAG: pentapeptide repeat-containing protein [Arcobacter sp.]|uniref:pentapeptide repeat-containing protein n=1 Tax=Arcobacter sp. TaxID=1872629 RepID=UPI003D0BC33F
MEIANINEFQDSGENNHECANFQYLTFKGLIFEQERNVVFFRSDFTGVTFSKCEFNNVSFKRSDFIYAKFNDCIFKDCDFKLAGIDRSILNKCIFITCDFEGIAIDNSVFYDCEISNTNFYRSEIRKIEYNCCKFINNNFKASGVGNCAFINSYIENLDFADLTADELEFRDCSYNNVNVEINFLSRFIIDDSFISNVNLSYLDTKIFLSGDIKHNLKEYLEYLYKKERNIDLFNIILTFKLDFDNYALFSIFKAAHNQIMSYGNAFVSVPDYELLRKILVFHISKGHINTGILFEIGSFLQDCLTQNNDYTISGIIYSILPVIQDDINRKLDSLYDYAKVNNSTVYAEIHFLTSNREEALSVLDDLMRYVIMKPNYHEYYYIVSVSNSKTVITIAISLVLALAASFTAKIITKNAVQTMVAIASAKRQVELVSQSQTIKELRESSDIIPALSTASDLDELKKVGELLEKIQISN